LVVVLGLWLMLSWADSWWPATILMFAPRWLLATPLLLLVPAALFLRQRWSLLLLGITAVLIAGPVMGFCVPWQPLVASRPAGTPFRVLTCNMHYRKVSPARLEEFVNATVPDIVALQEWPEAVHSVLFTPPAAGDSAGFYVHRTPRLFLASRYPIKRVTELGPNSYGPRGSVAHYELETSVGVVHLFSLHFASPRQGIYEAIHEEEEGTSDIQANSIRRWEQSEFVAGHVRAVKGPLVLVGDFNTPPQSSIFRQVWDEETDAFSSAGWGSGYTFFGGKTMVRIDHILASKGWYCSRCWVGPNVGSPHHPVVADLIWTGETDPASK